MKTARVVIGANFGDEGKGLVTDYLCSQGAGIVVRFNGGAQAGHTVVAPNGDRHVFHHIGSGTFCGIPTFLSQFFICNPVLFSKEMEQLEALGYSAQVYAHPDCLVTTFMDMLINQFIENKRAGKRHGSCGVGVHETMNRSNVGHLKITMGDLWNGIDLREKLNEICGQYAEFRTGQKLEKPEEAIEVFLKCCAKFAEFVNPLGMGQCEDPVFEGAQGLLLDQNNKEFFPHVTHSNTGMKNVEILCAQAGITRKEVYYVSRTYLTRHGAGTLPGEAPMSFEDNTNVPNAFQGTMRFAKLDCDKLKQRIAQDAGRNPFKLVLTHCDQLEAPCEADLYSNGPSRTDVGADKTEHQVMSV